MDSKLLETCDGNIRKIPASRDMFCLILLGVFVIIHLFWSILSDLHGIIDPLLATQQRHAGLQTYDFCWKYFYPTEICTFQKFQGFEVKKNSQSFGKNKRFHKVEGLSPQWWCFCPQQKTSVIFGPRFSWPPTTHPTESAAPDGFGFASMLWTDGFFRVMKTWVFRKPGFLIFQTQRTSKFRCDQNFGKRCL